MSPDDTQRQESPAHMDRRQFSARTLMALLSGVTVTVAACSDGSPAAPTTSPPANQGASGVVSANHGHTATITAAVLTAGNAVTLNIRGSADHPHTVTLTAAEVSQVASRQRVSKESSNDDGHMHQVTFN